MTVYYNIANQGADQQFSTKFTRLLNSAQLLTARTNVKSIINYIKLHADYTAA